jgi:heptosyltransferase-2
MPPHPDTRPRTVLLLQFTGIGDLVWHIHYFKMIAEHSRNGQVTIVAQPSTLTRAFIGKEAWVEKIIDHDHRPRRGEKRTGQHAGLAGMRRMARQLQEGSFDRIILFSGRSSRGLIAWLSDIPTRMGFGYRRLQRLFLNQGPYIPAHKGPSVAAFHEASAFMVAHGFCQAPVVPRIEPPAELVAQMQTRLAGLPRPLYAFAIGTSETHKQWGAANFAELARRIIERQAGSVLLLGGPAEAQLAQDIAALLPGAARSGLAIVTDAPPLGSAAALRLADACVGNDTGMTNVAAAVSTPTLALIGARPPLDHDPQYMHNVCAARLSDITVDQVMTLLLNVTHTTAPQP